MVANGRTNKGSGNGKITLDDFLGHEKTNNLIFELKEKVFSDIKKSNDYRTLKDLILVVEQTNIRLERIENKLISMEVEK